MSDDSVLGRLGRTSIVLTGGAILGVLLILAGAGVLFVAEGKALSRASSLEEGAAQATTIAPDRVDPANEGKLVHLVGEATTPDKLTDPELGIAVPALRLAREVEMYQWKEA